MFDHCHIHTHHVSTCPGCQTHKRKRDEDGTTNNSALESNIFGTALNIAISVAPDYNAASTPDFSGGGGDFSGGGASGSW